MGYFNANCILCQRLFRNVFKNLCSSEHWASCSFENWYVICGVIPTGPLTNVQLTMVTPGLVNPDVKYKLPIQPLQRVFHADAREDVGQVTLNLLLHGENEEAEVRGNEMSVKLLKNN